MKKRIKILLIFSISIVSVILLVKAFITKDSTYFVQSIGIFVPGISGILYFFERSKKSQKKSGDPSA